MQMMDFTQPEIHIAEPIVSESHFNEVGTIIRNSNIKTPSMDTIPAEPIQVGSSALHSEIHKLTVSIWNQIEVSQK